MTTYVASDAMVAGPIATDPAMEVTANVAPGGAMPRSSQGLRGGPEILRPAGAVLESAPAPNLRYCKTW
ncbi:hypothetical protein [Paraburkholderia sp. RL17-337-BIB-A]|uniref:hypothetical protein n=1 Tax=Paraburkholderia sp. RL17-337-BIB-A TaxID=3031636 RepID=UPI0038BA267F